MRKSVSLISAVLTAFVISILAGVVFAAAQGSGGWGPYAQTVSGTQSTSVLSVPAEVPTAIPTAVPALDPREAAAAAAKFLNRTDLYSVELASYQGSQVYKVTFQTGDIAYVSLNGQVAGIVLATPTAAPVVIVSSSASGSHRGSGAASSGAPAQTGGGGEPGDGGGD